MTLPRFGGQTPEPPKPGGAEVEAGSVDAAPAVAHWQPALLDFIPAVQTSPYNLRRRPHTMLAAAWNEEITIDADPDFLVGTGGQLPAHQL